MLELLVIFIGMAAASMVSRLLPLVLPARWLQQNWLHYLNQGLPLSIMVILLCSSLSVPALDTANFSDLLFEITALFIVLVSYIWRHNTLLSVIIGIISINLLYWIF